MQTASILRQGVMLLAVVAVLGVFVQDPPYELHWAIHVVPTCLAVAALDATIRYWGLTDRSMLLLCIFLCMHILGARYIYSYVPYDAWTQRVWGVAVSDVFSLQRNHYDRLVHYCYGLLIAPVVPEIQTRLRWVSLAWSYVAAVEFILATSVLFEIAEWLVAEALAPQFAHSYLGQQGDIWDAHKDMALAGLGASASMLVTLLLSLFRDSRGSANLDSTGCCS